MGFPGKQNSFMWTSSVLRSTHRLSRQTLYAPSACFASGAYYFAFPARHNKQKLF